jgi:DNA invertase Pin-like site-specific DNA recombinase
MSEYQKANKAELVKLLETRDATIKALTAEINAGKPDANGRKLNADKADEIRRLHASGVSKNKLSLTYQVSRDSIDAVLANKIYKVQIAK